MQKYVLLVDKEEDILELQEAALKYFYGGEIVASRTREEAIKAIERLGRPEIIIASMPLLQEGLHEHLKQNGAYLPLVATCSPDESYQRPAELSLVSTMLSRPVCPEELSHLVKSFIQTPPESPTHIPIKFKVAREVASEKFDLYLKLSGTNYVRITNKGNEFSAAEADKLLSKGITEVHIKASDSREFLKLWEAHLNLKFGSVHIPVETISVTDCLEQVERIARAFGWSPNALAISHKIVQDAIAKINTNEKVSVILKKKFSEKDLFYSRHVGLLCYLTCMLCSEIDMHDAREKLVMASLMHDMSLEESTYTSISAWNKLAWNLDDRTPEVVRYRLHPLHAAQTAQLLDLLPPEVDQIILQHHEAPDGSGFPRGLGASRIHFLAAIFIIAEDLVHFLEEGMVLETSLKDFLTWGEERYKIGNFKKIFEKITSKVS